jgi:hypothetical protein
MELSIGTIIKLILGLLVVAAVAYGLYKAFGNSSSFSGMNLNGSIKMFFSLIK